MIKIHVSDLILREKAEVAKELGHNEFKASTRWLDKFKILNGISLVVEVLQCLTEIMTIREKRLCHG
jgi:hypothetical protein